MNGKSMESVIGVYELRPYWGPELQRQFVSTQISVREHRRIDDLIPSIAQSVRAVIVIDLNDTVDDCLQWLSANFRNPLLNCPLVACASAANSQLEWIVREFGVTAFLPEVIPGDDMAHLCRRLLEIRR
jgi:hypothetical protein